MDVLFTILKVAVVTVLASSLLEALVLSWRNGWSSYDWKASAVSVVDFLIREYPLRFLLPLAFWTDAMGWFWQHRLWTLPMDHWTGWAVCFAGSEFCYYWYHRAAHRVRWFWCTHAVHHSPNQLNLSAAYRFGWTGKLTGTLAFFILAPLLGMPPRIVLMLLSLNLLYQFWIHATWIPRLGPLEWILNTPSAHRVHHSADLEYLDGNYGGVLIVFDRLFGTYIAERNDVPCRYGLVKPMKSYNLLRIEFGQWVALWRDLRGARSLRDAFGYLVKPPGWRPGASSETTEAMRQRAGMVKSTAPWASRWVIAGAAGIAAAASLASAAGSATPAQVAERPIAATELLSANWLRIAREPRLLREDGAEIVRFDERHDPGVLWNPSVATQDGDIDVDVRGRDVLQKSFVGIACRIAADGAAQVIWLRPFNFRSPDPVRRSHALQFAAHPDYPWDRLRREHPGVFETELAPAPEPSGWVHMHVELRGRAVRVFIDRSPRPALVVETPERARSGGFGLWVGSDSDGDFKNLRVLRLD